MRLNPLRLPAHLQGDGPTHRPQAKGIRELQYSAFRTASRSFVAAAVVAAWAAAAALVPAPSQAKEAAAARPGAASKWADSYLSALAKKGEFSGVVLVSRGGKPLFEKAYGEAVAGWHIPNGLETRFEIASLTKQFTGAAILQLAQAGKLGVEDPVSRYYPQAPATWAGITIRQLVTHTSGLPNNEIKDFTKRIAVPYTPDELIGTFRDRPLAAKPGTAWAYTNTEYYLLAYIIEKVSGQSYADYLAEHIFAPAGMTQSGFASTLAIVPQAAEGYARDGKALRHRDYFDRSLELGAGGIYSTVGDMARWNAALDGSRLLDRASLDKMFAPSVPGDYGYGWFITRKPRLREFHEGSDPGFAAFEARYPEAGALIVVFSNLEDAPVRKIEGDLAARFLSP
jgi:D-alanyl-D-alanine carboxypeptidase